MSAKRLATVVAQLEKERDAAKADLTKLQKESAAKATSAKKLADALLAAETSKYQACRDDTQRQVKLYDTALNRCQSKSWWESPTLWSVVGAAVGAGGCGLAIGVGK